MYNHYYDSIPKTVYYNPQRWIDYLRQRGITYHPLPQRQIWGNPPGCNRSDGIDTPIYINDNITAVLSAIRGDYDIGGDNYAG